MRITESNITQTFDQKHEKSIRVIIDEEVRPSVFWSQEFAMTAGGGVKATLKDEDEFGNETHVEITIEKSELDTIIEMFKNGFI